MIGPRGPRAVFLVAAALLYLGFVVVAAVVAVDAVRNRQILDELALYTELVAAGTDVCAVDGWRCGGDVPSSRPAVRHENAAAWWLDGVWASGEGLLRAVGPDETPVVVRSERLVESVAMVRDVVLASVLTVAGFGGALLLGIGPMRMRRRLRRYERSLRAYRRQGIEGIEEQSDPLAIALRETVDELGRTQEALLRAERMATLGYFSGGIAHQIGNPLSAARQFAEVATSRLPPDSEEQRIVERVQGQLDRIDRAVEGLMRFARPERLEPERIDLDRYLRRLVEEAETGWASHATITLETGRGLSVVSDPLALEQVLLNLLRNAVEIQPTEPRVRLLAESVPGGVMVAVEDRGPGFPEGFRPDVPLMTGKAGGTGLGLALAARLAELLGGRIRSVSVSEGARVEVLLPEALEAEPTSEHPGAPGGLQS